jgi:hypothetical protein
MLGYQQALCDLVASPGLCLAVRHDAAAALAAYELTPREHHRLAAVAGQPGMSTNCTLYRVNRITPIYSYLPLTCTLLGDRLIGEAERFWQEGKPADLEFVPETLRFAAFLRRRLADGTLSAPCLDEVLRFEIATHELRWKIGSAVRIIRFRHDPEPLLAALADGRQPAGDPVPSVDAHFLVLDARPEQTRLFHFAGALPDEYLAFNGPAA